MPSSRAESINCKSALSDRKLVPDDQIDIFCQILQFRHEHGEDPDTEGGRSIYYNRLRLLLPKLKFPLSSNPGFAAKLVLPKQSEYTYLCDVHKGLNADFVHQWFKFLALEVGARLEILRSSHQDYIGTNAWDNIIKPLTRLHKIWESRAKVEQAFGSFTEVGFEGTKDLIPAHRQADGCEACILARIGSHVSTLFALRAAVKSRISLESSAKHPSRLRLLRLIEPWIQLWQARFDYKPHRQSARNQQIRENTRLADELYCKREHIKIFQHELKYAHIQNVQRGDVEGDVFYQAENDIIDSYAALRATQRESQLIRSSLSRSQAHGSATVLSGEDPYRPKVDPTYRESRYSNDTFDNNERVIRGSIAIAADHMVPNRPQQTLSTQTNWGDVTGLGANRANAYATTTRPLERISERHSSHRDVPSPQGSIRGTVRGGAPPMTPGVQRSVSVRSSRGGPGVHNSMDMFDYRTYNPSRHSGVGSLVSSLHSMDLRDRQGRDSAISSMSSREDYRSARDRPVHQERPAYPEASLPPRSSRSYRDSQESSWTDASIPVADARLSRPFHQPDYETTTRERLARYERRR